VTTGSYKVWAVKKSSSGAVTATTVKVAKTVVSGANTVTVQFP